jgi:hypothetical protein
LASDAAMVDRAPASAIVRAVPVWAWLTALVVLSALVRFALARRIVAPWIMVDEMIHSELARGVAAGDGFSIRGAAAPAYGFVYPLLISPAYLVDSLPTAYQVVKAINALLMSLAALPAYLLARRVLPRGLSFFAALLAVSLPSLLFAGEVMTESAFYPLFLCVALALVLALERPTRRRQAILLGLCTLAYLTRAQALAFIPAVLTAPLLLGAWRAWRATYVAVAGTFTVLLAAQWVRGRSPLDLLGAYATTGEQHYDPREVSRWLLYHVAELDLYVGILPFAALLVLLVVWPPLPRALRPFLAATATISVFLLLEVSAFASLSSVQRIEERNLFYLAPLALIALLVWVDQGAPRPALGAGVAAVVAAALPAFIPYERFIGVPAQSDTLMILPLWRLHERWFALDDLVVVATCAAAAAAIAFLLVPRRHALLLPIAVFAFFLAVARPISARMEYAAEGALAEGMHRQDRDWIDRAVAGRGEVGVLWTGNGSRFSVWQNEFFNRSVGPVFYAGTPMEGGLPATNVTLDRRTGILHGAPDVPFVLTDGSAELVGDVVANDGPRNVFLYEVDRPLRQVALVEGLYPADTWSGPRVTYTRFGCSGGTVDVALQSDAALYQEPSRVRVLGTKVSATVPPDGRPHILVAPLEPVQGRCVARFAVSPTTVPGPNDPRPLGLHFNSFRYSR